VGFCNICTFSTFSVCSELFRGENNPSILDLIFTNEEGMIDNNEHCAPLGNSDHEVLEFKFLYKNVNDVNSYDRLRYFKGDYEASWMFYILDKE
jgi:hypothetical protein